MPRASRRGLHAGGDWRLRHHRRGGGRLCRARGVDVIVIDHHHVPSGPSAAYALLNPHRSDDKFAFKGSPRAGWRSTWRQPCARVCAGRGTRAETYDPREVLDLVALGTVADMVPLRDENRILALDSVFAIWRNSDVWLRALSEIAGVEHGSVIRPM